MSRVAAMVIVSAARIALFAPACLANESVRTTALPLWAVQGLRGSGIVVWRQESRRSFEIVTDLNPYYLQGDFDGDARTDIAVLVRRTSDGKRGIAVLMRKARAAKVLGAGTSFGNGGDDFGWMDQWSVFARESFPIGMRNTLDQPLPRFRRDALVVEKSESASALIYFNGVGYGWYQLGD